MSLHDARHHGCTHLVFCFSKNHCSSYHSSFPSPCHPFPYILRKITHCLPLTLSFFSSIESVQFSLLPSAFRSYTIFRLLCFILMSSIESSHIWIPFLLTTRNSVNLTINSYSSYVFRSSFSFPWTTRY